VDLADAEWRQRLTPQQYRVLRRKGTEMPITDAYTHARIVAGTEWWFPTHERDAAALA
jgi:peptide methionine sulfoxide reductase MsrB